MQDPFPLFGCLPARTARKVPKAYWQRLVGLRLKGAGKRSGKGRCTLCIHFINMDRYNLTYPMRKLYIYILTVQESTSRLFVLGGAGLQAEVADKGPR